MNKLKASLEWAGIRSENAKLLVPASDPWSGIVYIGWQRTSRVWGGSGLKLLVGFDGARA